MTATNEATGRRATLAGRQTVVARLSTLDRFLPVWILATMVVGLIAGRLVPGLGTALNAVMVDGISLPIAAGLLIMMYPALATVRYDRLDAVGLVYAALAARHWFTEAGFRPQYRRYSLPSVWMPTRSR